MFSSVADRTVIVTGGSRGIGRGIVRVFAKQGANVVIASRHEQMSKTVVEEAKNFRGEVVFVKTDVSDAESCKQMAAAAIEQFGGIDVLCANAGIFPSAKLTDMTPEDLEEVVGINLKGTVFAVQACQAALRESKHGRVILTSSITGPHTGFPGWSHYGATKAAQLGFMRTAAMEFAPDGVTVNAIQPGNVYTEGLADMGESYVRQMGATVPLGRIGDVEDIGNAALFYATDEAAYITGQALVVDGGQILPESMEAMDEMRS